MLCPHCRVSLPEQGEVTYLGDDIQANWAVIKIKCHECKKLSFKLSGIKKTGLVISPFFEAIVYPKITIRVIPEEVPTTYSSDFREACLVLDDSPRASAALSRRCLQRLIWDIEKVKLRNLDAELNVVIGKGHLPSHITESLEVVRTIGNFAAHPLKATATGEIIEVEPGEAEWSLDVLESLFDFYFVIPAKAAKRKAAHNEKLKAAGKPELK